jgi:hypothetical protein
VQQLYKEENALKPTPPRSQLAVVGNEEISKGKLGSAIVTMDACNSEKRSDLNIEHPSDIERSIPDWVFPTQQTYQLDIKAVQMACYSCPLKKETGKLDPK